MIELEPKPMSSNALPVIVSCAVELISITKLETSIEAVTGAPLELISSTMSWVLKNCATGCATSSTVISTRPSWSTSGVNGSPSSSTCPSAMGVLNVITSFAYVYALVVNTYGVSTPLSTVISPGKKLVILVVRVILLTSVATPVCISSLSEPVTGAGTSKLTVTPLILICFVSVIVGFTIELTTSISLIVTVSLFPLESITKVSPVVKSVVTVAVLSARIL